MCISALYKLGIKFTNKVYFGGSITFDVMLIRNELIEMASTFNKIHYFIAFNTNVPF